MALLIPANPQSRVVRMHPANGSTFTLEELQAAVEGYIELLPLASGRHMYVNEEGKLRGLPINRVATAMLGVSSGYRADTVVGNAVVCTPQEAGA